MEKRKFFLLALALILVLLLPLYGCGGGGEGEEEQPEEETEATEEVSIDSLFGEAQAIEGFSCDYAIKDGVTGHAIEGKMFIEGQKSRMEINTPEGQMIQIADMAAAKAYTYMPDQGMAFEVDLNELESSESPKDYVDNTQTEGAEYLGKEEVNGVQCSKWSVKAQGEEDAKVLMWLHNEYGLPVKVETTVGDIVSVVEYNNIEVGDIPDDMFTLPAGVTAQSLGDIMPSIPAAP